MGEITDEEIEDLESIPRIAAPSCAEADIYTDAYAVLWEPGCTQTQTSSGTRICGFSMKYYDTSTACPTGCPERLWRCNTI
jgi:hypothetical protein